MLRSLLITLALVVATALMALGQSQTVTGVVLDASDGQPLALANIQIKGTSNGTVTDDLGRFSLRVPGPEAILVVFYTGYQTQEVTVGNQTELNIRLVSENEEIEQVVVTAYGTVKKESLIGAQSAVTAKEVERRPLSNVTNALAGSIPGVQVLTSGGQPGSGASMVIRGFGSINGSVSPIYVVDGSIFNGSIADISPADIASVTALKDAASTALYGSSAGNGVILITTKSGSKSSGSACDAKPSFTFTTTQGVATIGAPRYDIITDPKEYMGALAQSIQNTFMDNEEDPLEAAVYWTNRYLHSELNKGGYSNLFTGITSYYTAASKYDPTPVTLTDPSLEDCPVYWTVDGLNPEITGLLWANDTDWEKYLFRAGYRQEYTLSGGLNIGKLRSYLSLNYMDERGYRINTHFSRMAARLNLAYDVTSWFSVGSNTSYTRSTSEAPRIAEDFYLANPFYFINFISPIFPVHQHDPETGEMVYDEQGIYGEKGAPMYDFTKGRPTMDGRNAVLEAYLDKAVSDRDVLNSRNFARVNIWDGLSLTANFNYDLYKPSYTTRYNHLMGDQVAGNGLFIRSSERYQTLTVNQLLQYTKVFAEVHDLDVIAGHESYAWIGSAMEGSKRNTSVLGYDEFGAYTELDDITSGTDNYRKEGWFARANYTYDRRYIASVSYRYDGTSRLADGMKWGHFWSVGFGWNISNEAFYQPASEYVNALKLRVSAGQTGNDAGFGYYPGLARWQVGNHNGGAAAFSWTALGNQNLLWEKQTSFDIAVDFTVMNRVSATLEFFLKNSDDLIFSYPLTLSTGWGAQNRNIGKVSNLGIEFDIQANLLRMENISWDLSLNGTWLRNRIVRLPEQNREDGIISGTKKLVEGRSIYDFWLKEYMGVDPETGLALYRYDEEKGVAQGIIQQPGSVTTNANVAKEHFAGSSIPALYGGFGTQFYAYGFDLGLQFAYQIGGKAYDGSYQNLMAARSYNSMDGWHRDILKAWQKPGDVTDVPKTGNGGVFSYMASSSDRWLTDASALMLRSITCGYTLKDEWLKVIQIKGLRIGFAVENVFLATARKGLNPMGTFSGAKSDFTFDYARTYTGSLTFSF